MAAAAAGETVAGHLNGSGRTGELYQQLIQYGMREDPGIETLLDLHGQVIDQGDGCWIKIEAWKTDPTPGMPHGVRYSLTLHERDNAHAVKRPKKLKYGGRILAYDHKHRHVSDKGTPYEFRDAHQLLADFFAEVDRVLREVKKR